MSDPLVVAKFAVSHADEHIEHFKTECAAYLDSDPCRQVVEYGFAPAQNIHKVKLVKPIPLKLCFRAFDAIVNLRSSLDQAGFAIAKAAKTGGADAHFPFGEESAAKYAAGKGRSRDIPKEMFDFMCGFQPYKGGDDMLWALNKLCNCSKHEIIAPMCIGADNFKGSMDFPGSVIEARFGTRWDSLKNEMMFARTPYGEPFDYNFHFTTFIALGNAADAVHGQEATRFLEALSCKVNAILLGLEAEARRIGLFK